MATPALAQRYIDAPASSWLDAQYAANAGFLLDADDFVGAPSSAPIGLWTDHYRKGVEFALPDGASPPLIIRQSLKGHNIAAFTAATSYLEQPYLARLNSLRFAVFIVAEYTGPASQGHNLLNNFGPAGVASLGWAVFTSPSNTFSVQYFRANGTLVNTPIGVSFNVGPQIIALRCGTMGTTAWYNRNLIFNTVADDIAPNPSVVMRLGTQNYTAPVNNWTGNVACVLLVNADLSNTDVDNIIGALRARFGTP